MESYPVFFSCNRKDLGQKSYLYDQCIEETFQKKLTVIVEVQKGYSVVFM